MLKIRAAEHERWHRALSQSVYCMSTFLHNVHCPPQHLAQISGAPYKVRQVSWGALSAHTVRLYVTDVSGATVGIEREGLQAICPGSRFEKGWQGWWHVQENGKYLVEKREYSPHSNPAQCALFIWGISFVMVLSARAIKVCVCV